MVGMFTFIQRMFGEINLPDSFYVGDASGRHQNWISGYKKDHSDADRKFALNNRLPFHIPETFFLRLNVPALPNLSFDPHNLFSNRTTISPLPAFGTLFEIIILVGIPAIGKSFFVERYLKKYIHASQDILKTKAKCIKLVEESLKSKLSVVIDNTNPDIQTRKVWIDLAKKYNANARVIHFNGSYELAIHNNNYRKFNAEKNVPTIAFNTYRKNFIEPSISEGISSIHIVDFDFEFKDEEAKEKWLLHY